MEALYEELWGKPQSSIMEHFSQPIFEPQFAVPPGDIIDGPNTSKGISTQPHVSKTGELAVRIVTVTSRVPVGQGILLARYEYDRIINKLKWAETKRFSPEGTLLNNCKLDYNISGQPGSGKSVFLTYLLITRLIKAEPTVYRRNDARCYFFDETHKGTEVDAEFLFNLAEQRNPRLWILTDACLTDERWNTTYYNWFIVLAASLPHVQASGQWKSDRNVDIHYMRPWSWNEIFAAFRLARETKETRAEEALRRLYTTYTCLGPMAGVCLKAISVTVEHDFKNDWEVYVSEIDHEIHTFLIDPGMSTVENSVQRHFMHKIAVIHPSSDGTLFAARITTNWIANRLLQIGLQYSPQRIFAIYKHLTNQPTLPIAGDWLFKAYGHYWFRSGGEFNADKLPVTPKNEGTLIFQLDRYKSSMLNFFTNPRSLAMQIRSQHGRGMNPEVIGKYYLPYGYNHSSCDGLVFISLNTVALLQITIAESYEVKVKGINDLCEYLPPEITNIHIVFVIPAERTQQYWKLQEVPQVTDITKASQVISIKQFRLIMTDDHIRSVSLPPGSTNHL